MHMRPRGFSLIELMIAIVVIGILASIALPSYQDYVRKARRADAQTFMMEVAARQQHFLVDRRAYAESITDSPVNNGLGLSVPASVANFYTVTLATHNDVKPPTYTITATPLNDQAKDKCGTLSLNQSGTKTATGTGSCW